MLRKMILENIKGFENTGEIEFRPITLLIGQNSSGKSSLMRFPLVLRQTLQDDSMAPLLFYGRSIDYGGSFRDVVFGHQEDRNIKFTLSFDPRVTRSARSYRSLIKESDGLFTMSVELGQVDGSLAVQYFSLGTKKMKDIITVSKLGTGSYHLVFRKSERSYEADLPADAGFDKFMPDLRLWITMEQVLRTGGKSVDRATMVDMGVFYDLVTMMNRYWSDFANSVSYIGPFRRTPERAYRHRDNGVWQVGSDGEFAPVVLAQDRRAQGTLVQDVSTWLHKHLGYKLHVDDLGGDMFRILIEDEETGVQNNLIDVGHGLSQLIPIVIQTFMSRRSMIRRKHGSYDFIVVEQPELHLHPEAQAHLADLFVDGIRLRKRKGSDQLPKIFLIETHSEHMLLRLRRYVAEGKLKQDDLAIYYTSKIKGTRSVKLERLVIDEDGSIPNWPEGFFSQDYNEVLKIHEAKLKRQANERQNVDADKW